MIKEKNKGSVYPWRALFYKELCDLPWNGQIILNHIGGLVVIIVFCFKPFMEQFVPLSFLLAFIFSILTMLMQGNLMVEEREQRTFRRLTQAGISPKELMLSKMLLTFIVTVFILIIFSFLYNNGFVFSLKLLLLALPILITILVAGTFLGIKSKNTIEVSLYGIPVVILYFFVEGLLMNSTQNEMPWLAVFPNYHLHYGIEQIYSNAPFLIYLVVPTIWMIIIILLFGMWHKKKYA